jgi:diguanylate cyclase (GGDEF)-like protein
MKRLFRNLPLRIKISLFTSLILGAALLILTFITIQVDQSYSKQDLQEKALILLDTLPYSIRDELYFVALDELKEVASKTGESEAVQRFVIYNPDGAILATSSDKNFMFTGTPEEIGDELISLQEHEEYIQWGDEYLTVGKAIYLNGRVIGAVSVTMSTAGAQRRIRAIVNQSIAISSLILLTGIALSFMLSKQLSDPLRELMQVSRNMSSGDLNLRVKVVATDEIGQLGLAFNEMSVAIQTRERDLKKLAASLEEKVEQRTEELRERNQELTLMASSDPLTKINNRRHFFDLALKEFERAKRYGNPLSLILADADYFKEVNDTYGHQIGDELLIKLAKFFQKNIRSVDIAARYGGEEFVILMPNIGCVKAEKTAERLRQEVISAPLVKLEHQIMLSVSFGVACWLPENDIDLETLIYRADKALYQSKHDGRNRVTVWHENTES